MVVQVVTVARATSPKIEIPDDNSPRDVCWEQEQAVHEYPREGTNSDAEVGQHQEDDGVYGYRRLLQRSQLNEAPLEEKKCHIPGPQGCKVL